VNDTKQQEPPWEDAIVAEVRKARVSLLAAAGNDLETLAARLRREQAIAGHRVVTFPPRVPAPTSGEAV
jgi:hypothetical protein